MTLESIETFQGGPTSDSKPEQDLESSCSSPSQAPALSAEFSEGGLHGWLSVAGGAMISFCTFGVVQSFGVYQDYYTRSSLTEKTPSEISWIGSVQVFLVFAVGLPAGKLMDMGFYRHTTVAGTLVYLFSIFMLSLVKPHHYYQTFLAQGVGMGLGMGLMFLPALTITSHYFRRRRSLAMGAVVSGGSIGGCLYPVLLNNIFSNPSGFEWGVRLASRISCTHILRWELDPNLQSRGFHRSRSIDHRKLYLAPSPTSKSEDG
ncbi:MFS general substrate transporter, partial [Coprinellus micaceus]